MSSPQAAPPSPEARRRWVSALRLLASAVIIGGLLATFDAHNVWSRLVSIPPEAVAAAIALFVSGQWLNAVRWRWLLRPVATGTPRTVVLFRLVMIGTFFGLFLPTTVGGDVIRAEMSKGFAGGRIPAYATILAARIMGLLATLLVGGLALTFAAFTHSLGGSVAIALLLCGAGLLLAAALVLSDAPVFASLRAWAMKLVGRFSRELHRVVATLGTQRSMLGAAFAVSVLIIVVAMIGTVSVLSVGLGIDAPIYIHWIAVPVTMVVTLLPVSFNGAGVREVAFVVLYARVGVDPVSATALGLAFTSLLTVVGLAGGLFFVFFRGELARS